MKRVNGFAALLLSVILTLTLVSCSSSSPTVMSIGGYEVSYDMLRYFVMNYKHGYEGIAPEDFSTDEGLKEKLEENTDASLKELAAYYLLAKQYKLKLTDEQKAGIESEIENLKYSYTDDASFEADLANEYVTEEVLREILTISAYCDSLYDYMTDERNGIFKYDVDTIMGDIESGNFFSAEYVYIQYSGSDYEQKKEYANKLLEEVKGGKAMAGIFDEYKEEYEFEGEYVKLDTFTYHEQNEYFEEAVLELEENECSEILEFQKGVLIIAKRLPIDDDYVDKNFNTVIGQYLSREFFEYIEEYSDGLTVTFKNKYKDLKYWEIT